MVRWLSFYGELIPEGFLLDMRELKSKADVEEKLAELEVFPWFTDLHRGTLILTYNTNSEEYL
jgi:hypothetical protein